MGLEAGTAWVTILPDVSKFGRDLNRQVTDAAAKAGDSGGGTAAAGFGSRMMRTVAGLGLGIGIGQTIGTGMRTAMDNELAQIKFTQLLGSTDAAKGYIADLQAFAAKTPFDFPGLADAAGRFLAVGTEADRVIPIMTTLGDATAMMGTGAAGIDRATTALTQMQQKGKVTGEEMMQLTEAGIPAWDALASSMGLTVPEVQDLVSKGLVPAEEMFKALEDTSGQALQSMAGGMDKMSQTTAGQWSTLKDAASQALGSLFTVILPPLTGLLGFVNSTLIPGIGAVFGWIDRWKVPLMIVGGVITAFFLPVIAAMVGFTMIAVAQIIAGWIAMAAQAVVSAVLLAASWLLAFWPVLLVIALIAAVIAVVWVFWDEIRAALQLAWDWVKQVFTGIWEAIRGAFQAIVDFVRPVWDTLWNLLTLPVRIWWTVVSAVFQLAWAGIKAVFQGIVDFVRPLWQGLWDAVKAVVAALADWIMPKFTAVKDFIVSAFTTVKDKLTSIWDGITGMVRRAVDTITGIGQGIWGGLKGAINAGIRMLNGAIGGFNSLIGAVNKVPGVNVPTIPKIPQLAEGGIVTRPTLAVIGEAGPEAVVPLDRYRGGAGPTQVRVFIGDRELTDIVRVEVDAADRDTAHALAGGRVL